VCPDCRGYYITPPCPVCEKESNEIGVVSDDPVPLPPVKTDIDRENATLRQQIKDQAKLITSKTEQIDKLEDQVSNLSTELTEKDEKIGLLQEMIVGGEKINSDLEAKIVRKSHLIDELEEKNANTQARVSELEAEKAIIQTTLDNLDSECKNRTLELQASLDAEMTQTKKLIEERDQLQAELNKLKS
jgi:DNA repair exonuclease SbcCD ATPase subunit